MRTSSQVLVLLLALTLAAAPLTAQALKAAPTQAQAQTSPTALAPPVATAGTSAPTAVHPRAQAAASARSEHPNRWIVWAAIGTAATVILAVILARHRGPDRCDHCLASAVPIAVALPASYLPARRATRMDPPIALRAE
ncbi:MAG: hypothetical protein ACRD1A_08180 [Terriglobales bacterium]